jgi:hypothetical protein
MPGEFLIDTGAYGAMIDLNVAMSLQLTVRGTREIHGIHGYGSLQQYLARLILPAKDADGNDCLFEQVMECVGVPSLTEKNREHDAQVIGILGRVFLQSAHLEIDGCAGRISLLIRGSDRHTLPFTRETTRWQTKTKTTLTSLSRIGCAKRA